MTIEKPIAKPRGAPFTARPKILNNSEFKNLCQLAFYDRGHKSLAAMIGEELGLKPRSVERWLANDERTNAPKEAIIKILAIAKQKSSLCSDFLKKIEQATN